MLNESQQLAVQTHDGPLLILAGAGTGKTRTLVHRLASLIESGIPPESILLLTFTRKAAREMLERTRHLLGVGAVLASGGTFHSFAQSILRKFSSLIGFERNFTVLDRSDSEDLMQSLRRQKKLDQLDKRFPRKSTLLSMVSRQRNTGEELESLLLQEWPQFQDFLPQLEELFEDYARAKRERGLMDYDDLLLHLRDLLVRHDAVRAELSGFYRYIMVDEYQDTNRIQAHIACLLASEHENLCVVGDDAQSIYGFRGSRVENMHEFLQIFPHARRIDLKENYRSVQPVLDIANTVLKESRDGFEKNLIASREGKARPIRAEFRDGREMASFVTQRVLKLREEGQELRNMAVLFRSAWLSNELELQLGKAGIPFVKHGGIRFQEAAHVKDLLCFLRAASNPLDTLALERTALLLEGVGPKTAGQLVDQVVSASGDFSRANDNLSVPARSEEAVKSWLSLLESLSGLLFRVEEALRLAHLFYEPILKKRHDDHVKRSKDLDSLIVMGARYLSVADFLTEIVLEPPDESEIEEEKKDESPLVLSTIHSAKGLEFDQVFLLHLEDGHLPSTFSLENPQALEEERRLLYVAITRARDGLYLLKAHDAGGNRRGMYGAGLGLMTWSRFLSTEILNQGCETETATAVDSMLTPGFPSRSSQKSRQAEEFLNRLKNFF